MVIRLLRDREATTSSALVSPSLLLCLAAAQATRTAAAGLRPRARAWEGDLLEGRNRLDPCRRLDLAVEQPTAVSGGGGSGVEALAAAAEETARSGPGSGGTAAGGGVWWRGWRRRRGRQGDGVDEVNLAALAADPAPGGLAVATVVAMTTAAQATTAGRLRRVSSELDDGDKVREDDEMAAGMEGWQGDGVGEANLAAPAAEPTPEEFGCRGDGGDELAATAARATTVGGLRRVPSELDDGEKGREDGEMAAGMEGQRWLWWWRPSPRMPPFRSSTGRLRIPPLGPLEDPSPRTYTKIKQFWNNTFYTVKQY
uniref:DUF834 domain-containing protein n=1 Tax=Oryza nivara TaxID=4536 RepID=A0A0E0J6Q7_ORYNI